MKISYMLPASLTAAAIASLPLAATAQYKSDAPTTTTQESRPGAANPPPAATSPAQRSAAMTPSASTTEKASETAVNDWERTHRATRIIGTDVRNLQGQKIGDVKDIVLDDRGGVAYAVVSTGGFLGMGDRLHAVPWQSLQLHATGKDHYVLDIDKARLALVPGFTSKSWPDFTDARWNAENRKHYQAK